ncbi:MAG: endonuclease/exonuclease/phosphatase family protein [Phycisphaerales bacterium]|nr:endonuclease/exonuclease/phosphatase family protein [Phycisphaerales bacterium]
MWFTIVVGCGIVALKRWRAGFVCVLAVCVGSWPLVRERALTTGDARIGEQVVMVGSFNMYPRNEFWDADMKTMMQLGLDVLVIQEVPTELSRGIRNRGYLEGSSMPYWVHRGWVKDEVSPGFVVSKYPLELIGPDENDALGSHQLMCIVRHPDGDFVVGLMHPWSPRSVEKWKEGNRVVRAHVEQVGRIRELTGLPMVVGADLNSTRGQYRSRRLLRSGLSPGKPLMVFDGGSFPAGRPGLMQIQLDDIWRTDDVRVVSWGMLDLTGSDHRAVIAGLSFDRESTGKFGSD